MFSSIKNLYINAFSNLSREIWLLSGVVFINRMGAMVIPFLSIIMTDHRGFTKFEAGLFIGAFGLGSIVGSHIGGKLTDRYGFYDIQFWSLFSTGFIFFALSFMTSFYTIAITMFLLSAVADMFRPANNTSVNYYSKQKNRTRSFGLLRLAVNFGFSIGPAIAGIIAGTIGYTAIFWIDGISCIVGALIFRQFLPRPIKKEKTIEKKDALDNKRLPSPLKDKLFVTVIIVNLFIASGFIQFLTAVPLSLKEVFLLSDIKIGLLLGLNGFIIAATEMPLLYMIEGKLPDLKVIRIGALFFTVSFAFFMIDSTSVILPICFFFFLTIGEMLYMPFTMAFVNARAQEGNRGTYHGYFSMSWSVAIVLGPPLGMYTAEYWNFPTLWMILTVLAGISTLIYFRLSNHEDKKVIAIPHNT